MDCTKCIKKCKAECCSIVPIDKRLFLKNRHKLSGEVEIKIEGDLAVCFNKKTKKCGFLKDNKCLIYEDRPDVCKKFGDESHILMTCAWQDKNGKIRTRAERRNINRIQIKIQNNIITKNKI